MTGNGPAPTGAYTFRYKQSSEVLAVPNGLADWAQWGAKEVAASGELQAAAGWGGIQRRLPTGGAAYGIPKNSRMVEVPVPATTPLSVVTIIWVVVVVLAVFVALDDPPPHPASANSASINVTKWPGKLCFRISEQFNGVQGVIPMAVRQHCLPAPWLVARVEEFASRRRLHHSTS
jgi:hypothetical protein